MKVLVEVSARHVHLSKESFINLFGKNAKLKFKKELSQKGQFLTTLKVDIITSDGTIKDVSILGPLRSNTQVEVSVTDSLKLGVDVPVRESGNIKNTPGCLLIGPKGKTRISNGLIVAKRHLHLCADSARQTLIKNGDSVCVDVRTESRSLIFRDVIARISENFSDVLHLDTDEANAAGISGKVFGDIKNEQRNKKGVGKSSK
ncbi:MAG: phosphate propanoyltransferase [Oscillospiraceae bacterium]|jgi:putative phosphotransacetylase|nr:phosphate propanoyltransferase [Oscillospiraceae bacterium]